MRSVKTKPYRWSLRNLEQFGNATAGVDWKWYYRLAQLVLDAAEPSIQRRIKKAVGVAYRRGWQEGYHEGRSDFDTEGTCQ